MREPKHPNAASSPTRDKTHSPYRDSPRARTRDLETGNYTHSQEPVASPSARNPRLGPSPSSPDSRAGDLDPILRVTSPLADSDVGRKKSLVRPERNRIDKSHPNYHYRQHAQRMEVLPSTTGNDPIAEEEYQEARTASSESATLPPFNDEPFYDEPQAGTRTARSPGVIEPVGKKRQTRKLTRKQTKPLTEEEKRRQKELDSIRPPSAWNIYCSIITFWAPDFILKCFGMPARAQRRAWREKIGLISIILLICAFVGFLTFGFTQAVCSSPGLRLKINHVDTGYMIFHGRAYNLVGSQHPAARGIPLDSNVLYDLPHKYGGQDASFMFQQVNGACKGLITLAEGSDVPTNSEGELAWYFPCTSFNQDGSSEPNLTVPYYKGYACHTTATARDSFYSLHESGEVFFTWDDIKNSSRNLAVYSNSVLDLNLINWFNKSQVAYPAQFDELATNPNVKGVDLTRVLQSSHDRQVGKCLSQIIKVGSIDTESIGCIASKVVLYVSLVFILSIVLAKFFLAITDPASTVSGSDGRTSKRASTLFPQTSRFTSPYAVERMSIGKPLPTTMTSQAANTGATRPVSMYKDGANSSSGTLDLLGSRHSVGGSRMSLLYPPENSRFSTVMDSSDTKGPQGCIHENVVPQPPPEWQPFGFPLAHALCLVTAYSEGEEGLRTTLDSIAMTDYPNSHKAIIVICDGLVKGKGETLTTPDIALSMMGDFAVLPEDVEAFSYVAVASGSKRHNMAKVYAGFYDYGQNSCIPIERQQRVPMMVIVKCGTPDEAEASKPGNRGKRDSQVILMSFLQKVMFDERMTELEYEIFNGLWKVTGMSPDFYEVVLMVDADTKVFPDSLTHMVAAMVHDPEIMGLCGETKIANKRATWVSMIQVFEYFISHHLSKSFESVFGGVTCLPGCFCMYRIKAPKGGQNYWVPILANPDVVERYSENVVDTLHKKNLLLLGEDRYLSTLMLKTFPKRKQVFVPQAVCKTTVPEQFSVLLSQRRRWINSTVHNLMELILVRDLWSYILWMLIYILSLPIWNFVLPINAYWKFDDFSWGDTRKTAGEKTKKAGLEYEGEFDSSKITMKRWGDFERERRTKGQLLTTRLSQYMGPATHPAATESDFSGSSFMNLPAMEPYRDY
ncbi:hypothetical protein DV738_g3338, partial [Chaetothyriales sp. CBS 135597]